MAVDGNLPPFQRKQPVYGFQQRGFPAPAGTEDTDDLLGPNVQIQVIKGDYRPVTEDFRCAFDTNFYAADSDDRVLL